MANNLILISERLRNLGKYTFADVTSIRLGQSKIRILSSIGTLITFFIFNSSNGWSRFFNSNFIWIAL